MRLTALARAVAVRATGSAAAQAFLQRGIGAAQYLMGVGAGSSPESSGEVALVPELRRVYRKDGESVCVFDVGANRGDFARLILEHLSGVPTVIHAFEPSRGTFEVLQGRMGALPNVRLNQCALGRAAGEAELHYDAVGSGLASLTRRRLDHLGIDPCMSEVVRIETLDEYCRAHEVAHIDLLKLDVEGHELDVLEGARRMLAESQIGMISFEFGGTNIDTRTYLRDFFLFFAEVGMSRMARITPAGTLVRLPTYKEAYEQFTTTNFVVFRAS